MFRPSICLKLEFFMKQVIRNTFLHPFVKHQIENERDEGIESDIPWEAASHRLITSIETCYRTRGETIYSQMIYQPSTFFIIIFRSWIADEGLATSALTKLLSSKKFFLHLTRDSNQCLLWINFLNTWTKKAHKSTIRWLNCACFMEIWWIDFDR